MRKLDDQLCRQQNNNKVKEPALNASHSEGIFYGGHHSPLDFIYQLDDGTAEDAIGLTAGGDIISLNEFAVVPGSDDSIG